MIKKRLIYGIIVTITSTALTACLSIDTPSISAPVVSDKTNSHIKFQSSYNVSVASDFCASGVLELFNNLNSTIKTNDYELPPVKSGIKRRRIDNTWCYVDNDNNVLQYDYMREFTDKTPFSIVQRGDKNGIVNANYKLIIPMDYDNILRAYKIRNNTSSPDYTDALLYAYQKGTWSTIDIENKVQVSFISKSGEKALANLSDSFDFITYNGKVEYLKYYGEQVPINLEIFLPAFNQQNFQLFSDSEFIGEKEGKMIVGDYEDEIKFDFNIEKDVVAVLGNIEPVKTEIVEPTAVMSLIPDSYKKRLTSSLPIHALKFTDTNVKLIDFYYTSEDEYIYHVFAISSPENLYHEIYYENQPNVDPISEVLFAAQNRNKEYIVLCKTADKSGEHVNALQFIS